MKLYRRKGFTIVEVLVVLAIISVLAAILLPIFGRSKRSAEVTSSVSRLRQLYLSLELYIESTDGAPDAFDGTDAYYRLGLPTVAYYRATRFNLSPSFWESPCGFDPEIATSGPNAFFAGSISYVAPYYSPETLSPGSGNLADYGTYLQDYRQNAVAFVDSYCNESGMNMTDPFTDKRGIAVTLSGQVINRIRRGNAFLLQFYSDPPSG